MKARSDADKLAGARKKSHAEAGSVACSAIKL